MVNPYNHTQKWEIEFLETEEVLRSKNFGITAEAKTVRYPVRLLRYWFGYHLLAEECRRAGRPIDVGEIGIHNGQMLLFAKLAASKVKDPGQRLEIASWLGVDAVLKHDRLAKAGYTDLQEANLEDPAFEIAKPCDTAICLHVFEHLSDPEDALRKIAKNVRPGGSVIGGFPVLPHPLIGIREKQVRKTAQPMGHVSIFSPERVKSMAESAGLKLEFSSGAFFARRKGSKIENSPAWLRFNLWWGNTFPWWPGEIYWLARKPKA